MSNNNDDNSQNIINNPIEESIDNTQINYEEINTIPYDELVKKYKNLEFEIHDIKDKYIRVLAEYQNYQRRNEDEKRQLYKYGHIGLMKELIRILDNLQKAFNDVDVEKLNDERLKGIFYIKKDFENILKSHGLSVVDTYDTTFNPQYHEAVITSDGPKGLIIKEIDCGYKVYDKVIRPAKVIVGNGEDHSDDDRQKKLLEITNEEF